MGRFKLGGDGGIGIPREGESKSSSHWQGVYYDCTLGFVQALEFSPEAWRFITLVMDSTVGSMRW